MFKRFRWHVRRIRKQFGGRVLRPLIVASAVVVVLGAVAVTLTERSVTFGDFWRSLSWAASTVLKADDISYVSTPWGLTVHWTLTLFGVAMLAAVTGAIVGFVIDFLVKEGQGMGATEYEGHIVICGWNATARDLVGELLTDAYGMKVVLLHETDKNPAGEGVYLVNGDPTNEEDLERAGIRRASAAIVCPTDPSDAADMRTLLIVLAIESYAPGVRTVVEVNNPRHLPHFERTKVDEVLITSRLASRLLARTAMYPGLGSLVTDIVSGGEGSELYRVLLPDDYVGLDIDDLSARLRREHHATLMAVVRDGKTYTNPGSEFRLEKRDEAVVVAVSLGTLAPLTSSRVVRVEMDR
ncbi:MAG: TrkA family potassium uptake protein [Acidimicrobiia bacterium]|nr:TrkA family potassium uptake protein [Acidimicrobiia bacterium]